MPDGEKTEKTPLQPLPGTLAVIWGGTPGFSGGPTALCNGGGGGVLSALGRANLSGNGLGQKGEGIYPPRRRAGVVAPLKLMGWLL